MSILYQPQYRVHGTVTWSNWGTPISTTSTVVGLNPPGPALIPSTQYDFQVVASNSFGSTPSSVISATTSAGSTIQSVALSPQTFVVGGPAGTIVGAINITMSSGSFTGTLQVTGTDAAFFQIAGGNLTLSGTTTTARTYSINIVATQSGISNSPFSQPFPSITGTSASQEAAEGLIVNTVGPIMFASQSAGFASPSGPWDQFTLTTTGATDPHISRNGVLTPSGLVAELIYHNHTVYQENTQVPPGWWFWNTNTLAWVEYGVSSVSLNSNTYAASAPAGTLIGVISVTMKDASTFSGTLSIDDTTHFQIVGNQLQAAATLSNSSYPINITAVPAVSGANKIGEPSTLAITVQVQTVITGGSFTPPRPQGAIDGGYSNLVFFDDFLDTTTMAPVGSYGTATSGHKWYWSYMVNFDTVLANINPAGAATGPYASTTGGVMTMNVTSLANGNNATNIATIPGGAISSYTQLPAAGHWRHMYIEGLFMYNPSGGTGITSPRSGWPGFWSWTAETTGFGFPYAGNGLASTEVDFWEYGGGTNTVGLTTVHSAFHPTGGFSGGGGPVSNNVWFKAGMLWVPPTGGQTVGTFTFYFNDVAKGNSAGNPPTTPIESCTLFLTMGSGYNWPFQCDWVSVWQ